MARGWADVDARAYDRAIACCRGVYQRDLIAGIEAWSGSTLRGKAKSYSGRYAVSRENLLDRLEKEGLDVEIVRREHGKKILIIRPGCCLDHADCLKDIEVGRACATDERRDRLRHDREAA